MFPGSPGGTTSLWGKLTLSFLLIAMLGITGVPSFAETPATPAGGIQSNAPPPATATTAPATAPARERRPQPLDEVSAIFEQKGVLTPKYSVTVEPSVQYTHSSSNRVALLGYTIVPAITVGLISAQDVDDDMIIAALAFRFGITNRLEFEFKIPYVYRNTSGTSEALNTGSNIGSVFNATGYGFGDEEATLRWQINQPVGPGGIYIASLRGKLRNGKDPFEVPASTSTTTGGAMIPSELPVGSGFYTIQPGITMIFPADPAVLFGSMNYQWNVKRDIGGIGTLDPGDALEVNFGMGIGLNENLSFSLGYDHTVLLTSTLNGDRLGNSKTTQVGVLLLGTSYRVTPRTNINVSLGIGATSVAPDVQFTVKVPTNFF